MEIVRWSDCDEARKRRVAMENIWSMWSGFARTEGCSFGDLHGALCLQTPMKAHPYNIVHGFDGGDDPEGRIDRAFAHFAARETPFLWFTSEEDKPADMAPLLEARAMHLAEPLTLMVADLRGMAPQIVGQVGDITITEATADDEDELVNFISWRWQVPAAYREKALEIYRAFLPGRPNAGARAWLARRDGKLVGKSVLHLGGGVAGLHGVIVTPEARKCGLGHALTTTALAAGLAAGYEVAALGSSPMAESLYASLGFQKVGMGYLYAPGEFHV